MRKNEIYVVVDHLKISCISLPEFIYNISINIYKSCYLYHESFAPIGHESALADRIYNTLSNKYYWRHWLVVVYKEMHLEEKHWRTIWGVGSTSVNKLHWKGRYNVIVSSVPGMFSLT